LFNLYFYNPFPLTINHQELLITKLNHNDTTTTVSNNAIPLFTELNFQRLKRLQQEIHNLLEMSPSIRKIINSLITDENLEKVKAQLLKDHSE
jgi:hypothetical protein